MIDYQLKECCNDCKYANLDITAEVAYRSFEDVIMYKHIIYCKHQPVCQRYLKILYSAKEE